MKILIADKMSSSAVKALEELGAQVAVNADLKAEDLPAAIGDADILIVRSTKVTTATIDAAQSLSLIIRAGAGVNTIDIDEANRRGIYVANCPGKNTDAVAELAIGLMISADRRLVNATNDLRAGKWRKKEYGKARGLKGRTLGIVGLGSIGKAVAKCAKGLDMEVIAWSRSLTPEKAEALEIGYCESPLDLARLADVVSVHLAAKAETKNLISDEFLGAMKEGSILINTSRGEVVDTGALKKAIEGRNIKVGLDVFENEPAGNDPAFADTHLAALITGTPHIGASTDQASEAIAEEAVRVVRTYCQTGKPVNSVNVRERTSAIINLVIRHFNRVGVLAGVLDELRTEGVNIEEMENTVFEGGAAACCTLKLDQEPSEALVAKLRRDESIIQIMLK